MYRRKRNDFSGAFKFGSIKSSISRRRQKDTKDVFIYVSGVDFFSMSVCHVKIKTARMKEEEVEKTLKLNKNSKKI